MRAAREQAADAVAPAERNDEILTAQELLAGSLLVHDPLCPLTSAEFLAEVRRAGHHKPGVSLAAFRPVTDTVKTVVDERIHGTIAREGLAALLAPVLVVRPADATRGH